MNLQLLGAPWRACPPVFLKSELATVTSFFICSWVEGIFTTLLKRSRGSTPIRLHQEGLGKLQPKGLFALGQRSKRLLASAHARLTLFLPWL